MTRRFAWVGVIAVCGSLGATACSNGGSHTTSASLTPRPTTTTTAAPVKAVETVSLHATPGVTPSELARADSLLRETIAALPTWQTPAKAYAAGYRSIGDAVTGDEHYVNWSYVNDGHTLDPERPESIVYEYRHGTQQAVAAMYMLPFGSRFTDVPDVGGALTQWHVHRDLCLTNDPQQKLVAGFTALNGPCPTGTGKAGNTPMLHVWVVPNPCGPFAALEGGGAGQVPTGQTRLCDTTNATVP